MAVTVRELIAMLEAVENKDLDVVVCTEHTNSAELEVIEGAHVYYGKSDTELGGWTACTRECVVIEY